MNDKENIFSLKAFLTRPRAKEQKCQYSRYTSRPRAKGNCH